MEKKIGKTELLAQESCKRAQQRQIAIKLLDEMDKLYEREAFSARRWVWELLQNAKDVALDKVKVDIIFEPNSLEFKHSGKPFTLDNIVFLINQTSSKERVEFNVGKEMPQTTGKFGTGFLTTHLLSKIVLLNGIYEDKETKKHKRFEVLLNRDATTPEKMIENVYESFKVFELMDDEEKCPYIDDYKVGEKCDTSFKYYLTDEGRKVALEGLDDFYRSVLLTMAFLPQIESIYIDNKFENFTKFYKRKEVINEEDEVETIIFEIKTNDEVEEARIPVAKNEFSAVALKIEKNDLFLADRSDKKFKIIKRYIKSPGIFVDFPLIGSEIFEFPAYVNSHLFNPNEPRSLILLQKEQKAGENKKIMEAMIPILINLLKFAHKNCEDFRYLIKTPIFEKAEHQWFKEKIQLPIRKFLLDLKIFPIENGYIQMQKGIIPNFNSDFIRIFPEFNSDLNFIEFVRPFYPNRAICQDKNLIDFWTMLMKDNSWKTDFNINMNYSLDNLLKEISNYENLDILEEQTNISQEKLIIWLNDFLNFLVKTLDSHSIIKMLDKYTILPDQTNIFRKVSDLFQDDNINEILKTLYNETEDSKNIKTQLLSKKITKFTLSKVMKSGDIIEKINEFLEKNSDNEKKKEYISFKLISTIPDEKNYKKYYDHRMVFWEWAQQIHAKVPTTIFPLNKNYQSLWVQAEKFFLKQCIKKVEEIKTIENLLRELTREEKIKWLNYYYEMLEKHSFLDYNIYFPNQNGRFLNCKKTVYSNYSRKCQQEDHPLFIDLIDKQGTKDWLLGIEGEKLKDIYESQTKIEIRETMILKEIKIIPKIKLLMKKLTLEEICKNIEKEIIKNKDRISTDANLRKNILKLDETLSKISVKEMEYYFPEFAIKRANFILETISDPSIRSSLYKIIASGKVILCEEFLNYGLSAEELKVINFLKTNEIKLLERVMKVYQDSMKEKSQ